MLRFDFLPSDFHPQFLVLGEREDLSELADRLEILARDGNDQELRQPAIEDRGEATLTLSRSAEPTGLRRRASSSFAWVLSAELANDFAAEIRAVAEGTQPAGSAVLTVTQFDLEEIPVWISQGEFTDSYLINKF